MEELSDIIMIYTLCCPCSWRVKIITTGEMTRFLGTLFQRICMKVSRLADEQTPSPVSCHVAHSTSCLQSGHRPEAGSTPGSMGRTWPAKTLNFRYGWRE